MWATFVLIFATTLINVSSQKPKCPSGFIYVNSHCYSESYDYDYIEDAQKDCKSQDAYVMIINTLDELEDLILDDIIAPGDEFIPGLFSDDNGTTWTYYDYSMRSLHLKAIGVEVGIPYATDPPLPGPPGIVIPSTPGGLFPLPPGPLPPPPTIDHLTCRVSGPMHIRCRPTYSDIDNAYLCERNEYLYPEPCDLRAHRKLRRNAARTISWTNDTPKACYIEIQGRRYQPAQLKVYGYVFNSMNPDECDTGFMIQMGGDVFEDELNKKKLRCGDKTGGGKAMLKKRTARGGKIRVYFLMNGFGEKVWIRAKARSF